MIDSEKAEATAIAAGLFLARPVMEARWQRRLDAIGSHDPALAGQLELAVEMHQETEARALLQKAMNLGITTFARCGRAGCGCTKS